MSSETSRAARSRRALFLGSVGLLLSVAQVSAQRAEREPDAVDPARSQAEISEQRERLRERDRATMHPGAPLTLIGVEQGDNDIRSRTPALMQSDRNAALVDPEDAYQRTVEMFESGARFHAPTAMLSGSRPATTAPPERTHSEAQPSKAEPDRKVLQWVLSLLISAILCAWGFKRFGMQSVHAEA